jgi:hypothetical protein
VARTIVRGRGGTADWNCDMKLVGSPPAMVNGDGALSVQRCFAGTSTFRISLMSRTSLGGTHCSTSSPFRR